MPRVIEQHHACPVLDIVSKILYVVQFGSVRVKRYPILRMNMTSIRILSRVRLAHVPC